MVSLRTRGKASDLLRGFMVTQFFFRAGQVVSGMLLLVAAVGLLFLTNYGADAIITMISGSGPLPTLSELLAPAEFVRIMAFPLGALALAAGYLLFEAWRLGFANSSLSRLLQFRTDPSAREDLFYLVMTVFSITRMIGFLMSFGIGYFVHHWIKTRFNLILLAGQNPIVQMVAMVMVNTLGFYWFHRLMHTAHLWDVHKVHHAATSLNVITPHRNHPLDKAIFQAFKAVPAAVLGVSSDMILAYEILNGIYQQAVHSHLDWGRGFVGRYLIINPSRHWLHHATDSKYWGKNFGILVLWERLFGTYRDLEGETLDMLQFGFADDPHHNQGRPWRSLWSIYLRFLRSFVPASQETSAAESQGEVDQKEDPRRARTAA
jgi:sterol desaturase/sphingolipid hydroxylase (fatty acid hydroxylase superfamily)